MAANKIILKIEEEGIREAAEIVDAAKKKAADRGGRHPRSS